MHIGRLTLVLVSSVTLLTGALLQGAQKGKDETPAIIKLFEQAKADDYIGDQACAVCHSTETETFHKSGHAMYSADPSQPLGRTGCESCHGPGKAHQDAEGGSIIGYSKEKPADINAVCMRCHADVMSTAQWHRVAHARAGLSCVSCHQLHPKAQPDTAAMKGDHGLLDKKVFPSAKESNSLLKADEATLCSSCHRSETAQFRQNSHHPVPEGRLVCSDCHDIHPSVTGEKKLKVIKDECVSCHADKAGPFVYEHDPVAGWMGTGCTECHEPHGSHNPSLLKGFSRGICAQCHTDKLANHFPGRSCWNAGCHVALHGSNTDPHFLAR
jgi:predicted CXXCH cytochrome family protein